jgi:triphosphoribosyl-dephospho-CoA synthase
VTPLSPRDLARLVTQACLLEAAAPKPGNVAPGRPFRDMSYEDFRTSAVAIGPELGQAGTRPLGETILAAVRATRARTRANTNLGIVLLLTPLARAAASGAVPSLRNALTQVLSETTVADARLVYQAIREAGPGGLGQASEQDVAGTPEVPLREAMRLAADRDLVAAEYASDYRITFDLAAPALARARLDGLDWEAAIVDTFLILLAGHPDTLIARKLGRDVASAVSLEAGQVLRLGGVRSAAGRQAVATFDAALRDTQNSRNPGTTADLTAAAVLVELLQEALPDSPRTRRAQ